jgi:hypothetical protein
VSERRNPRTGRRLGAPAYHAKPLVDDDGKLIALKRKMRVRLVNGRMADPCWVVVTGSRWPRNPAAYVYVPLANGAVVVAHRHAWAATHGRDIEPGHVVHHPCFHKHCVNPAHLQLTTFGENSRQNNFPTRYVEPEREAA